MEDIGDILYIILMLVFVIVGVIRKNFKDQKPPARPSGQSPHPQSEQKYDPFEEIKRYILDEPEEEQPVPEPVYQENKPVAQMKKEEKTDTSVSTLDNLESIEYTPINYQPIKPTIKRSHHESLLKRGELQVEVLDEEEKIRKSTIDLKQAIIYDAILNRPDY